MCHKQSMLIFTPVITPGAQQSLYLVASLWINGSYLLVFPLARCLVCASLHAIHTNFRGTRSIPGAAAL